ncbi:MAG: hydantoinase/oxoprolinase family protein [Acidimicrobiia bacterium]
MGATVSIDTGGTFTDGYFTRGDQSARVKVDTTPHDVTEGLARCVAQGATALGYPGVQALLLDTDAFRFSSTIGTNSIIQRSGPRVGLMVSAGAAEHLYGDGPSPLYDVFLRRDLVAEISDPHAADEVKAAIRRLLVGGARVLVASLAGSEDDPGGEQAIKKTVYGEYPRHYLGAVPCLVASDVTPRPGAARRTATAVIDAYLYPDMVKALYKADEDLRAQGYPHPLLIVHASGSVARVAKTRAIETYSSGPAGGVYGSARLAHHHKLRAVVTMDIGGTSTDISFIDDARVPSQIQPEVAGIEVHTPRVRVDALGGGGGSIARRAAPGFTVGPDSVGAVPGPACYGLGGTQPTVTDAEVVLGHLDPAWYLGGRRRLDPERARTAIGRMAGDAGDTGMSVEEAAWAVHRALVELASGKVAAIATEAAVPASEIALFAFGGAGGLVAAEVAARSGLGQAYSFVTSAVFSAFGIAGMPLGHIYETAPGPDLAARLAILTDRAALDVAGEGFDPEAISFRVGVDHTGGHSVLPVDGDWDEVAARVAPPAGEELLAVRLQALVSIASAPIVSRPPGPPAEAARKGRRDIWRPGGRVTAAVYDRELLAPGATLAGPALVEGVDTTIVVPEGFTLSVDEYATAVLEASRA